MDNLKTFFTKQKELNVSNKQYFNNDTATLKNRRQARQKIENSLVDGVIHWPTLKTKLLASNTKLQKIDTNNPKPIEGTGLSLSPSFSSGYNTCSFASECAKICLTNTGHGQSHMMQTLSNGEKIHYVHVARQVRTIIFFEYREQFKTQLIKEIRAKLKKANSLGITLALRLNVLSDIEWEKAFLELWELFPDVIFYDYTKNPFRKSTSNYPLTFSRNEINQDIMLKSNDNIAVVFNVKKDQPLPKTFKGRQVIDGDLHDNRFSDQQNIIVGLRAKGIAQNSNSQFVVKVN